MTSDTSVHVSSMDRQERIRARRQRIETRNALKADDRGNKKTSAAEGQSLSQSQQQIATSLNVLDRQKLKGIEVVTNVRVEGDHVENVRRGHEEEGRKHRLARIQEEAIVSGKRNAAVEMRWSELLDYTMPSELNVEMQLQKDACDRILATKDELIREFSMQLKLKDEEYVRTLKRESEDVETLLTRMNAQLRDMTRVYASELVDIEAALMKERDELLQKNKGEIDTLFEKRRAMEMAYMDAKQARDEQYQKEIETLRTKDAEDYAKLKIKLGTDIQTLEQQLEEMRATYQLNTEKLEYNYRVLTERDMENSATLSQQKRKLSRLKDALSALVAKFDSTDARERAVNTELTEDYRRITKQYQDLQEKVRHFRKADEKKYQEVWDMHVDEVEAQVVQMLQADKVIHEQQLGRAWSAPPSHLMFEQARDRSRSRAGTGAGAGEKAKKAEKAETEKMVSLEGNADEARTVSSPHPRISTAKLKLMIEMLCREAGFLIEPSVRQAMASLPQEESELVQADSILRALGITQESEIETLVSYFFDDVSTDDKEDQGTASRAEIAQRLGLKLQPEQVVQAISAFVQELDEVRGKVDTTLDTASVTESLEPQRPTSDDACSQVTRDDVWTQAAHIIPDKTLQVWQALEKGLLKYNHVLEKRAKTMEQVSSLEQQNEELKALLRQYLGNSVNDQLIVPPSQTIRVRDSIN